MLLLATGCDQILAGELGGLIEADYVGIDAAEVGFQLVAIGLLGFCCRSREARQQGCCLALEAEQFLHALLGAGLLGAELEQGGAAQHGGSPGWILLSGQLQHQLVVAHGLEG